MWTAADVARVARYANEEGAPWGGILAGVLAASGLLVLVCAVAARLSRLLLWWGVLRRLALQIGSGVAILAVLRRVARLLTAIGVRLGPRAGAAILAVAALLFGLAILLEQFTAIDGDIEIVRRLALLLDEWCSFFPELAREGAEGLRIPSPRDFGL